MLVKLSSKVDKALYANANFNIDGKAANGNMLVILEDDSLKKIIDILKENMGVKWFS